MKRVLTGITTSGTPHIGNYVGAIRPAIAASRRADVESFYFLADLHALIKTGDPARVARSTLEIAATWLALGLDPARVFFYRQSDIPEIPELTWFLTCVTPKGLLNRAHAYKAATDANREAGEDADAGITAGLYMYPVLMAADILVFNAHAVPVGRDQIQHIEIARDIGQRFNHLYGREYFTLPEAQVDEATAILPGLDGRKMSKSYDNVIPLWDEPAALERKIMGIVTNSQPPGEPKNPDDSALYTIWQAFATPDECADMRRRYAEGIAWGEAKKLLAARIDAELAPARAEYRRLIADPAHIESVLRAGAERARARVAPFLKELRNAVGLRQIVQVDGMSSGSVGIPSVSNLRGGLVEDRLEAAFNDSFRKALTPGKVIPVVADAIGDPDDEGRYTFEIRMTTSSRDLRGISIAFADRTVAESKRQLFHGPGLKRLTIVAQPAEDGLVAIRVAEHLNGVDHVLVRLGERSVDEAEHDIERARQSVKLAIRLWEESLPTTKLFRETDGSFKVKVVDPKGKPLAESAGFPSNQHARLFIDFLLNSDPLVLERNALVVAPCEGGYRFTVHLPADTPVMHGPVVATEDECRMAYARFEAARAALSAART